MRQMPARAPARRLMPVLLLAACLAGCGKKAPPFLPESRQPKVFARSGAAPFRSGVLVWWEEEARLPAAPEGGWEGYRILRTPEGGEAVEVRSVPQRGGGGGRYEYLDLDVIRGGRYSYRVRLGGPGQARSYASPDSAVVAGSGPPPPFGLSLRDADGLVELGWEVPEAGSGPPVGFNVFRRTPDGEYRLGAPLNPSLLGTPRFLDATGGAGHCYCVTSAVEGSESIEESVPSGEVCAPLPGGPR